MKLFLEGNRNENEKKKTKLLTSCEKQKKSEGVEQRPTKHNYPVQSKRSSPRGEGWEKESLQSSEDTANYSI